MASRLPRVERHRGAAVESRTTSATGIVIGGRRRDPEPVTYRDSVAALHTSRPLQILAASSVAFVVAPIVPRLVRTIGKKRGYALLASLMYVGALLLRLGPVRDHPWTGVVAFFAFGLGLFGVSSMMWAAILIMLATALAQVVISRYPLTEARHAEIVEEIAARRRARADAAADAS